MNPQVKTKLFDNDKEWNSLMCRLLFTKIDTEEWIRVIYDIKKINKARNELLKEGV